MNFHNDPSDTISDFLPKWDELANDDFDAGQYVRLVEESRQAEYAALADL